MHFDQDLLIRAQQVAGAKVHLVANMIAAYRMAFSHCLDEPYCEEAQKALEDAAIALRKFIYKQRK